MNGDRILADTNIILYLLSGKRKDVLEVMQDKETYVSFITEIELLSFQGIKSIELDLIKNFLNECIIIDINSEIKEISVELRKKYKLKLPDAIILSTAKFLNISFLTADKVFKRVSDFDIILFEN